MATLTSFAKIFLSHFSSESMMIPAFYYDELPLVFPKTVLLQGSGGCFWKVAMMKKRYEVYFGQGWVEFVEDNRLRDGDVLTFVYDGYRKFKVSIYGSGGCKEARAVAKVIAIDDDKEDSSVRDLSIQDTNTSSEPEIAKTVPRTVNKGKKKAVEDPDESFAPEDSNSSDNSSEPEIATRVPRTRNKGKKKVVVADSEESEDSNNNDSPYSPRNEDYYVTPRVTNSRKEGMSKSVVGSTSCRSHSRTRERQSTKPTIKNPEVYLDDPKNLHFETTIKKRIYELLIRRQLLRDFSLRFGNYVHYIDNHEDGKLKARTGSWKDRVCIKRWNRICERNGFRKGDCVLCELLRKGDLVYAIKIHTVPTGT